MNFKNLLLRKEVNHPQTLSKYEAFIESEIPENSIVLDKDGTIISDKLSLLKFVDFLLTQYEYCPENNSTQEFDKNTKVSKNRNGKKKSKLVKYAQLTPDQKKKKIKNMNQYVNGHSEYPA